MRPKYSPSKRLAVTASLLFSLGLPLGMTSAAYAQLVPTTTDAGRIQKDIERQLKITPGNTGVPEVSEQPQLVTAPEGAEAVTFRLNNIIIKGAKKIPPEKLRSFYAPLLGKEIKLTQVYEVANKITAYYREQGYILSRAFLPEQEIRDGVIQIQVVEGFVSGYRIQNPGGVKDQIEVYAKKLMNSGPLTSENLERYLLLMNDLPGVTVRSVLVPSKEVPDSAELVLTATEKKLQGFAKLIVVFVDQQGKHARMFGTVRCKSAAGSPRTQRWEFSACRPDKSKSPVCGASSHHLAQHRSIG